MDTIPRATAVEVKMAFTRAADVVPDSEREGLLRARIPQPGDGDSPESFDLRACRVRDWSRQDGFRPDLLRHGFDCVDLSPLRELQAVLERVREAGRLREADVLEIRRHLTRQSLRLGDGSRARLLFIAPEGFIMRKAGPNGMAMSPPGSRTQMNDHDAASAVHADQDIGGTPLKQMMRGAAPRLFRHEAPDSRNGWSPLLLLNLWIPLQQITRPLALMDTRSLDRRAQQLRYGLPTDDFLDRDDERRINDIWTFLHDDRQEWWFHPDLNASRAYLFETLGTPHGSFIVPGEDVAEARYQQLEAASEAIRDADLDGLQRAVETRQETAGEIATDALRRAVHAMDDLLEEARGDAEALCRGSGAAAWRARAGRAMDAVVRKSVEMRVVAVRTPRLGRR